MKGTCEQIPFHFFLKFMMLRQAGGISEDRPPAAGVLGAKMGEVGGALLLYGCAGDDLETEEAALPDGCYGQLQRLPAAVEPQRQKAVVSGHRA